MHALLFTHAALGVDAPAILFLLAGALAAVARSVVDAHQDTVARYTIFDIIMTSAIGLLIPPAMRFSSYTATFAAKLDPLELAAVVFLVSGLGSFTIVSVVRRSAPGFFEKVGGAAAARALKKIGGES